MGDYMDEHWFEFFPECHKCGNHSCCHIFDQSKKPELVKICADCDSTKREIERNSDFQKEMKRRLELKRGENNGN